MIRTQVYLPKELYQSINLLAEKENRATAELIRELLIEGLKKKQDMGASTLLKIAHKASKGAPVDLSSKIDEYLYE